MRLFFNIARLAPAVILLTFAVIGQAFAMSHGMFSNHHGDQTSFSYVICADGELKSVKLDSNGQPIEHEHSDFHCPLCVLSNGFVLSAETPSYLPCRTASKVEFLNLAAVHQVQDLRPDTLHGQDPPRA